MSQYFNLRNPCGYPKVRVVFGWNHFLCGFSNAPNYSAPESFTSVVKGIDLPFPPAAHASETEIDDLLVVFLSLIHPGEELGVLHF
jgi:hypothetical protein